MSEGLSELSERLSSADSQRFGSSPDLQGLPPAIADLYQSIGREAAWEKSLTRVVHEHPWARSCVSRIVDGDRPEHLTCDASVAWELSHVRNAARLHTALQGFERTQALLLDLMNRLRHACVLVDRGGCVTAVSGVARKILEGGDGLSLNADGGLTAWKPELTIAIRDLVARTLADGTRQVLIVPRPSGLSPYMLMAVSLRAATGLDRSERTVAAVLLSDPGAPASVDESLLRLQYGLTRAEARLANTLVEGLSLDEAADRLCVSVNTVRTHLARILLKTGTSRQGQLLRTLLRGLASID